MAVALLTGLQMLHACRGVTEDQFGEDDRPADVGRDRQYGGLEGGTAAGYGNEHRAESSANIGGTGVSERATGELKPLLAPKIASQSDSWGKMRRILHDPAAYALMVWSFFYVCGLLSSDPGATAHNRCSVRCRGDGQQFFGAFSPGASCPLRRVDAR